MKKTLLLLLPFVVAALATHVQTVNYGVKGGLNLSTQHDEFSTYYPSFFHFPSGDSRKGNTCLRTQIINAVPLFPCYSNSP